VTDLAILAAVFVAYALVSSRLERLSVTAPMVFVAAGLILGPSVTGALDIAIDSGSILPVTELTLAIILFADASTVRLNDVEGDARLPARLLLIGLPLTIALGTVAAGLSFPSAGWAAAALIASILAPTDAALGLAVVTNRAVPVRIRRALNVESGLTDGIATPFVTVYLTLLVSETGEMGGHWALEAAKEIGLGLVAAVVVGTMGGRLLEAAGRRRLTSTVSEQLAIVALALLAYAGAVAIGGNGFIAAFIGGLLFGAATRGTMHGPVEFAETVGLFASFFVWTMFGVLFVGPIVTDRIDGVAVAYALLSLTVVRMLPVAVSLLGVGLRPDTIAFVGWFGPRGLASVVFALVAVETLHQAGAASDALVEVATWTILISVIAHGVTAGPLARIYGRRVGDAGEIPELLDAPEPRVRRRHLGSRAGDPSDGEP
jgi:NhaP-type Na+/H+ or K+/H+ antiporter